jgi:hypothetical protein
MAITPKPPVRVPKKDAFFRSGEPAAYSTLLDQSLQGDQNRWYLSRLLHSTRPPMGRVNTVVIL